MAARCLLVFVFIALHLANARSRFAHAVLRVPLSFPHTFAIRCSSGEETGLTALPTTTVAGGVTVTGVIIVAGGGSSVLTGAGTT